MTKLVAVLALALLATDAAHCADGGSPSNETPKGGKLMTHQLPPLPYAYDALEPYYDEQTVRLHHEKHHAAYVAGLNKAEEKLAEARKTGDNAMVQHWERQLAFHGSGHLMHTLFWQSMSHNSNDKPGQELADQIAADFGDMDAFKAQFTQAAATVEGSGWAALAWSPEFQKLYVLQIENHQKQVVTDTQILMVVDMWEHAYYLKFQNRRPEWLENWWKIVNWDGISERFRKIKESSQAMAIR